MEPEEQIAQIERDFAARIAAAAEGDRPALQLEREQAKNNVWVGVRAAQKRGEIVTRALAQFPRASQSAIVGVTEEEIMASAKGLHEHVIAELKKDEDAMRKRLEEQAGQRLYGTRPVGAGGGTGSEGNENNNQQQSGWDRTAQRITEVANAHKEGRAIGLVTEMERDQFVKAVGDTLIQRQINGRLPDGREPEK